MRKLMVSILTLVMILSVTFSAFAAGESESDEAARDLAFEQMWDGRITLCHQ